MDLHSNHITINLTHIHLDTATHAVRPPFIMPSNDDCSNSERNGRQSPASYDDELVEFQQDIPFCGTEGELIPRSFSPAPWNVYQAADGLSSSASSSRMYQYHQDDGNVIEHGNYNTHSPNGCPLGHQGYHHYNATTLALPPAPLVVSSGPGPVVLVLPPSATGLTINVRNNSNNSSSSASLSTTYGSVGLSEQPSSALSSRRSSGSPRSDVNNTILRQRPCTTRFELVCEFRGVECPAVFDSEHAMEWEEHTVGHLEGKFPSKVKCCRKIAPLSFVLPLLVHFSFFVKGE